MFGIGPIELLVLAVIGIVPIGVLLMVLRSSGSRNDDQHGD